MFPRRLQLHDDLSFDDKISNEVSNQNAVVEDGNRTLLLDAQALPRELVGQGVRLNLLKKASSQSVQHLKAATNDLLS